MSPCQFGQNVIQPFKVSDSVFLIFHPWSVDSVMTRYAEINSTVRLTGKSSSNFFLFRLELGQFSSIHDILTPRLGAARSHIVMLSKTCVSNPPELKTCRTLSTFSANDTSSLRVFEDTFSRPGMIGLST